MGKKIKTRFIVETGISEAIIWVKGKRYRGTAVTHELDKDVMNPFTGQTIALARAEIKREKAKDSSFAREVSRLRKLIEGLVEKREDSQAKIVAMEKELNDYIEIKSDFANKIRDMRLKKEGIKMSMEVENES